MNERSFIINITMTQELSSKKDKRQAILTATLKLLASYGFHGFSMKQLATEAGIATGTIYLYFKDRDTLIAELHTMIIKAFADAAFENLDAKQTAKVQYQQICKNIWLFCINNRTISLSKAQFDHLPTEVLKSQRTDAWHHFQALSDLFEQGRQRGLIKDLPNDVLSSLSFEPYMYMATQQLLDVIDINQVELDKIMDASWDAISTEKGKVAGEGEQK